MKVAHAQTKIITKPKILKISKSNLLDGKHDRWFYQTCGPAGQKNQKVHLHSGSRTDLIQTDPTTSGHAHTKKTIKTKTSKFQLKPLDGKTIDSYQTCGPSNKKNTKKCQPVARLYGGGTDLIQTDPTTCNWLACTNQKKIKNQKIQNISLQPLSEITRKSCQATGSAQKFIKKCQPFARLKISRTDLIKTDPTNCNWQGTRQKKTHKKIKSQNGSPWSISNKLRNNTVKVRNGNGKNSISILHWNMGGKQWQRKTLEIRQVLSTKSPDIFIVPEANLHVSIPLEEKAIEGYYMIEPLTRHVTQQSRLVVLSQRWIPSKSKRRLNG